LGVLFQGGLVVLDSVLGLVGVLGDGVELLGVCWINGFFGFVDFDVDLVDVVESFLGLWVFVGYAGWLLG